MESIPSNNQNKGEKDEVLLLQKIFDLDHKKKYKELVNIFGDEASEGVTIYNRETMTKLNDIKDIQKAKSSYKADACIMMNKTKKVINPSIKSVNGGNPSILNHTPRCAKCFQPGGGLHHLLPEADNMMGKYIELRKQGRCEEIPFKELNNFSDKDKETLIEITRHFMFDGTGKCDSKVKADSILIIKNDQVTFKYLPSKELQREYIRTNFNSFNIACVSRKGLPKNIKFKEDAEKRSETDEAYSKKYQEMKPWIFETTDNGRNNPDNKVKLKAALHIRLIKKYV